MESIYYTEAEHYHNIKECFCELINDESEGRALANREQRVTEALVNSLKKKIKNLVITKSKLSS